MMCQQGLAIVVYHLSERKTTLNPNNQSIQLQGDDHLTVMKSLSGEN